MTRPTAALLSLATLLFAAQAHASALAISDVPLFDLTFGLTAGESVTTGVPDGFCLPQIGSGDCGKKGIHGDWKFPGPVQGPTAKDLQITGFGSAKAFSPPAALSWYIEGIGGFFFFTNNTSAALDIDLYWNIGYILTTEGIASRAGVTAIYSEENKTTGTTLINPTVWPGFKPPSVQNGKTLESAQNGIIVVSIPAFSTTELNLEVEMSAFAAQVNTPDPSTLLLTASGLIALLTRKRS